MSVSDDSNYLSVRLNLARAESYVRNAASKVLEIKNEGTRRRAMEKLSNSVEAIRCYAVHPDIDQERR